MMSPWVFAEEEVVMVFAPAEHAVNDGDKRFAEVGDAVFGAGRKFGVDSFFDKTVFDKFF